MNYFKEIEFEMPEDPGAPVKKPEKVLFNKDKLETAIVEIKAEFERIREGTSALTTYPIDPTNFGFPASNRLTILEKDPTQKNYLAFLEIVKQDLGQRVAVYFMEVLKDVQQNG